MAQKDLIIIGGGGHSRALIGVAEAAGLTVRGLITSSEKLLGTDIFGVPVLCLEAQFALDTAEVTLVNGVGNHVRNGEPNLAPRAALYARYKARGYQFLPLISHAALIMPHVIMGAGVQVMPGAIVQSGCIIGENVIINTGASVDHDVVIEPHCHIAPGAVLCGNIAIGEGTHIGAGATIIDGIRIGKNVVIGAGAVVFKDVPDNATIRGGIHEQPVR